MNIPIRVVPVVDGRKQTAPLILSDPVRSGYDSSMNSVLIRNQQIKILLWGQSKGQRP